MLVDAGGGNGILTQLDRVGLHLADIHHLFITHAHTDHLLGAVWIIRVVAQMYHKGIYEGRLHIYSHARALDCLKAVCEILLPKEHCLIGSQTVFHQLNDCDNIMMGSINLTAIDIHSTKEKQFGFRAVLPNGQTLVCLGDEPFNEENRPMVQNADWLLSEAFCLYRDRNTFKPYEKNHSTALDAGRTAQTLEAHNLVLYHTEDTDLAHRKALYTREAARVFDGKVFVPNDLETIVLH